MTTYYLYDDDVALTYEKRGRSTGYWIDERPITRVTSVGVPVPFSAALWYGAGLYKEKLLEAIKGGLIGNLDELDEDEWEALAESLRKRAGTDTVARDRGTRLHGNVEDFITRGSPGEVLPEDEQLFEHWRDWWEQHEDIEIHGIETKVYSKAHDYAGTLDLDATLDGRRSIVDWKFGSVRPAAYLQTSAYAQAREEELDAQPGSIYDQRVVVSIKDTGVTTVRREGYQTFLADFEAFLNLLEYDQWLKGPAK